MCVILTADLVVFTDCPPGPDEQNRSIRTSFISICTSNSSASGKTITVAADVCTRPCVSVCGTRCTRCTPASYFKDPYTSSPDTSKITSLKPPDVPSFISTTEVLQPLVSQYFVYIRNKSPAKIEASSPPVPARISTITFLAS